MTRVATPANEPALLQIALHGTASHVEKLVGRYEWTKRASAAQDAQMRYSERAVHYYYEMGNTLVVHARLPRDIGALVVKALQVASDIVREAAKPTDVSAEPSMQLTLRPEGVKR